LREPHEADVRPHEARHAGVDDPHGHHHAPELPLREPVEEAKAQAGWTIDRGETHAEPPRRHQAVWSDHDRADESVTAFPVIAFAHPWRPPCADPPSSSPR